jgi:hypothetical protein
MLCLLWMMWRKCCSFIIFFSHLTYNTNSQKKSTIKEADKKVGTYAKKSVGKTRRWTAKKIAPPQPLPPPKELSIKDFGKSSIRPLRKVKS